MRNTALPCRRQRGAIAIMFGLMVLGIMGLIGFALDLTLVYNRKAELQALADATALAAARTLNGTAAGVASALTQANLTANNHAYQYNNLPVAWSNSALRFSTTAGAPDAAWLDAAAAQAAPAGVLFAKVDTRALGDIGNVGTAFIRVVSSTLASVGTAARAVAGRASTNVLPLAICAQSATPAASRANVSGNAAFNELVEYGFRRGVAYDLMQLNPGGTTPENFLIDPLSPPGVAGSAANMSIAVTGPFVCSGNMPMASVLGGQITVQRGFPIGALYKHLNSRLDLYDGNACTPEGAPPDSNVKPYVHTAIAWMLATPGAQTAAPWTSGNTRLWTRADPLPGDAGNTATLYGPLWAYARAVPFAAYAAAPVEPAAGYAPFAATAWSSLYTPGPPTANNYPSALPTSTPYLALNGIHFQAPAAARQPGLAGRRVLNVALLSCPVAAGGMASATVLAVGRFFMTVAATNSSISAEFAGTAAPAALGGAVELLR
ncbi:pilus assembly protein TadG-related protein [Duganella sp. CT11-25]|uniref:pilus assembly protein TadG-related protein n=1 Tax=unclassified Duganella TaxID=2636909 RepID=UPI0039B11D42